MSALTTISSSYQAMLAPGDLQNYLKKGVNDPMSPEGVAAFQLLNTVASHLQLEGILLLNATDKKVQTLLGKGPHVDEMRWSTTEQ